MPESTYSPDFTRALAMTKGMPTHWTDERKIGVAVNEVNRQLTTEWCKWLDKPVDENGFMASIIDTVERDSLATRIDKLQADKIAYINSICPPPVMLFLYEDDAQDEADRRDAIEYMRNGQ